MWQNTAFILICIGILVLIGWAVKAFFMEGDIPILIRIAVGAVSVGVLILIAVAFKDRLTKAKDDKFKEVER